MEMNASDTHAATAPAPARRATPRLRSAVYSNVSLPVVVGGLF